MKINITPEKFESIIAQYLLDVLINEDHIRNEDFVEIVEHLDKTGIKSKLLNYYLSLSSKDRTMYKRIKKVLNDPESQDKSIITISNSKNVDEETNEDYYKILYLTMEALKISNKQKIRKNRLITEKELEKIVKKVVENNKK